jgi:hypothetical protein
MVNLAPAAQRRTTAQFYRKTTAKSKMFINKVELNSKALNSKSNIQRSLKLQLSIPRYETRGIDGLMFGFSLDLGGWRLEFFFGCN